MDKKVPEKKVGKEEDDKRRTILWLLIFTGFLIYVVVRFVVRW